MTTSVTRGKIDFLIVGAEKSGTTWLAKMLRQHPKIYLPPQKELYYFNRRFVEDPRLENQHFKQPASWYLRFFADARPDQKGVGRVGFCGRAVAFAF